MLMLNTTKEHLESIPDTAYYLYVNWLVGCFSSALFNPTHEIDETLQMNKMKFHKFTWSLTA